MVEAHELSHRQRTDRQLKWNTQRLPLQRPFENTRTVIWYWFPIIPFRNGFYLLHWFGAIQGFANLYITFGSSLVRFISTDMLVCCRINENHGAYTIPDVRNQTYEYCQPSNAIDPKAVYRSNLYDIWHQRKHESWTKSSSQSECQIAIHGSMHIRACASSI